MVFFYMQHQMILIAGNILENFQTWLNWQKILEHCIMPTENTENNFLGRILEY